VFGGLSVVDVFAELFGGEVRSVPFVYMVDCWWRMCLCPSIFMVSKEYRGCVVGWECCVVWEPLAVIDVVLR